MLQVAEETARKILRLQTITLIWMAVEALIALRAAWTAHSPALLGFGGDSAVELLSAIVVFWRFFPNTAGVRRERRAAKIAGGLLFLLAGFVVLASLLALLGRVDPRPSLIGIALLILAAAIMPWLAREKRRLATVTASAALRADATESAMCGYLALIALAGLALNAVWNIPWADPLAALALLPLIVHEGWEALEETRELPEE
jgi:divalent metal cation (Fe/Co/Zn/Cd) transporter